MDFDNEISEILSEMKRNQSPMGINVQIEYMAKIINMTAIRQATLTDTLNKQSKKLIDLSLRLEQLTVKLNFLTFIIIVLTGVLVGFEVFRCFK